MRGVAAGQVVLDAVVDEADQVAVGVDQHGDEQVPLEERRGALSGGFIVWVWYN